MSLAFNIPWEKIGNRIAKLETKPTVVKVPDLNVNETLINLREASGWYQRTPDQIALERQGEYTMVFLYCEFQRGGSKHTAIKDIIKLKDDGGNSLNPYAFTKDAYEVWQTRDGINSYPVALTSHAAPISFKTGTLSAYPKPAKLRGRVYLIRSDLMNWLDNAKQNGVQFRRSKIDVIIPYTRIFKDHYDNPIVIEDTTAISVWTYLGKHKHWDEKCSPFDMDKCKLHDYRPTNKHSTRLAASLPFYYFNAPEIFKGVQNK